MTENISFNLLDNPWIPCKTVSNEFKLLSIKEILFNPSDILEITSENPLISISIYRLLLAILHRNFGPKDKNTWANIYKKGQWDIEVLESYFEHWHHRFELFSEPENRFYQIDLPEIDKKTPISKLNHAISSGNNVALFNHSWDSEINPVRVEEGAQLLIAYQNYAVGGGNSIP
ncbi:MAG: type I-E CRISPR-associated protein Cse1/CasA, partial [Candidatus Odinarchaeota archaeon]